MGGGSWTTSSFTSYCTTSRGIKATDISLDGTINTSLSVQDVYKARRLDPMLDPSHVMRECRDSEEHPNTIPVILALDVTGSMGDAATEVAKKLNVVMTKLYDQITDVEFCVIGIGDLAYDNAPIQISQFESDIRIAEQMDKVYFEFGGGGNSYESYTAAWYMGARHTNLDCWSRGKKGIIITMGDERLNPYLPKSALKDVTGDGIQNDIDTKELFTEVSEKYNVFHLDVRHGWRHDDGIAPSWLEVLDNQHFKEVTLDSIADTIVDIIVNASEESVVNNTCTNSNGEICW